MLMFQVRRCRRLCLYCLYALFANTKSFPCLCLLCLSFLPPPQDYIMHMEDYRDEGVIFRSFKYRRCPAILEDVSVRGQPVRHISYYPPPIDRLLVITEVRKAYLCVFLRFALLNSSIDTGIRECPALLAT